MAIIKIITSESFNWNIQYLKQIYIAHISDSPSLTYKRSKAFQLCKATVNLIDL